VVHLPGQQSPRDNQGGDKMNIINKKNDSLRSANFNLLSRMHGNSVIRFDAV
jgi:hypothetical protein